MMLVATELTYVGTAISNLPAEPFRLASFQPTFWQRQPFTCGGNANPHCRDSVAISKTHPPST